MEVFCDLCPAKIFAVTGSDGKTTTTTLIYNMLKEEGYKCWLGGNIGAPLLDRIDEIKEEDIVVLELSSFQLHTMKNRFQSAVVTNMSPNHLDVHNSMDEYIDAKKNIYRFQTSADKLILNYDNAVSKGFAEEARGSIVYFSRIGLPEEGMVVKDGMVIYRQQDRAVEIMKTSDIRLPGVHNIENYLAAAAAVIDFVKPETIRKIALSFGGVEHRNEYVKDVQGVSFYNDSYSLSAAKMLASSDTNYWSNITGVSVFVTTPNTSTQSMNIDSLAYNVTGKARILFTFDDAWMDVYQNAFPILTAKGYKATAWASKDLMASSDEIETFMSTTEMNVIYNAGWDIGNHTISHIDDLTDTTKYSDETVRAEYLNNQNWLLENNWTRGAYHVCYPQGSFSDRLISILKGIGVKSGRTTVSGYQTVPVYNIYKLKCIPVGYNLGIDINAEIDDAVKTGSTVMFMLHKIENTPNSAEAYSYATADFQSLVNYIDAYEKAGQLKVVTISEWYDEYMKSE